MLLACTRAVSPGLADCELTHREREPLDYDVIPVAFAGCLHLKSGVTRVDDGLLLPRQP